MPLGGLPLTPAARQKHLHRSRCLGCHRGLDLVLPDALAPGASVTTLVQGLCTACASERDASRRAALPLASAQPRTLRLLMIFVTLRDASAVSDAGLAPALVAGQPLCESLHPAVAHIVASADARATLDALLAKEFGARARPFEDASLAVLAESFVREAPLWPCGTLFALLWSVARRHPVPYRRLEERIAARLDARGGLD